MIETKSYNDFINELRRASVDELEAHLAIPDAFTSRVLELLQTRHGDSMAEYLARIVRAHLNQEVSDATLELWLEWLKTVSRDEVERTLERLAYLHPDGLGCWRDHLSLFLDTSELMNSHRVLVQLNLFPVGWAGATWVEFQALGGQALLELVDGLGC